MPESQRSVLCQSWIAPVLRVNVNPSATHIAAMPGMISATMS